jgi:hypothetical protein
VKVVLSGDDCHWIVPVLPLSVIVDEPPLHIVEGEALAVPPTETGFTVTDALPVEAAPFVTFTLSVAGVVVPAVQVICVVPCPAVIVPFVRVHAYVAPAPAFATDAVLPVERAHTVEADVVIVAFGEVGNPSNLHEQTLSLPSSRKEFAWPPSLYSSWALMPLVRSVIVSVIVVLCMWPAGSVYPLPPIWVPAMVI